MNYMIFTVLLLIFLLYMYKNCNMGNSENYYNTTAKTQCSTLTPDIMSGSMDILLDPTFSNITVYNNDENPYIAGQQNGLSKCLGECKGNCVEFGMTGTTTCYPN